MRRRLRSRALIFAEGIRTRIGARRNRRSAALLLALRKPFRALVLQRVLARQLVRIERRMPVLTVHFHQSGRPSADRRSAGNAITPPWRRPAAGARDRRSARSEPPTGRMLVLHRRGLSRGSEQEILRRRVERRHDHELVVRHLERRFGPLPARAGGAGRGSAPVRLTLGRPEREAATVEEPRRPEPRQRAPLPDPGAETPVWPPGAAEVEVAQLTDQVIAAIDRRIVAQRERRGGR